MTLVFLILSPILAALISLLLTPLFGRLAVRIGAIDRPGPRKVHEYPVPRLGGLAVIVSAALVGALLLWSDLPHVVHIADDLALGLVCGLAPIVLCSILDDITPLPALPKLAAHLLGAAAAVSLGVRLGDEVHLFATPIHLGAWAIPLSIVWLVGLTNALNIVDGLDGLSAGLAFMSALSLAGAAVFVEQYGLALLALTFAGALAGFLPYNVYPARVFLGDSGATAIGFTLGCLALRGGSTLSSGLAILTPILVLGLPIAETLVSVARRVVRGLRGGGPMGVMEADAGHFHHRLLALGFGARGAVFLLYGVGLTLALTAYVSLFLSQKKAAVLLLTMIAAAFIALSRLKYEEFAVLRRGDLLRMYEVPGLQQRRFTVFIDLAIVVLAVYFAFVLKYDDWQLVTNRAGAQWLFTVMPPACLFSFALFGVYRRVWRFASLEDLALSSSAAATGVSASAILSFLLNAHTPPLTFFATCGALMLLGLNLSRSSYRLLRESRDRSRTSGEPVIIYGAGRVGSSAVREILARAEADMRPIGFLDDHPGRAGKIFSGYPVLGNVEALDSVLVQHAVRGVIVATSKLPAERLRAAAAACSRRGVWIRRFHSQLDEGSLS
jgi:UDP-GlcNAc:undecaprenyl-phosphate GlcNAc-1-phosphate transferase